MGAHYAREEMIAKKRHELNSEIKDLAAEQQGRQGQQGQQGQAERANLDNGVSAASSSAAAPASVDRSLEALVAPAGSEGGEEDLSPALRIWLLRRRLKRFEGMTTSQVCDRVVRPMREHRVAAVWPPCGRRVAAVWPPCDRRVTAVRPPCDHRV